MTWRYGVGTRALADKLLLELVDVDAFVMNKSPAILHQSLLVTLRGQPMMLLCESYYM